MKYLHALLALALLIALAGSDMQAQQQAQLPAAQSPANAPQSETPPTAKPFEGQAQPPTIRATTGLVRLVATVTDRRHNFITDLAQNDFKVIEDGAPQNIQFFLREANLPLRIALLLDTSNSIRPRLEFEQDAAIDFLNSVIRRNDKDQAFLMTFDNEPEIIQDYTGDLGLLMSSIRKQRAGGGTALNDAIYKASEKLLNPPPPKGPDLEIRRVLVVISDGNDNLSDHALSEAIDEAMRAEVSIYAISTNTDWLALDTDNAKPQKYHLDEGDKVLQSFADETGGRVFFPYKVEDLGQSFVDIGAELRSQYFIAYVPTNPLSNGGYRKIQVETARKGLIARTRKGYYAAAPTATAPPPGK